jgi:hypothetical protein
MTAGVGAGLAAQPLYCSPKAYLDFGLGLGLGFGLGLRPADDVPVVLPDAKALSRLLPSGLPHPLHASHPGPAL